MTREEEIRAKKDMIAKLQQEVRDLRDVGRVVCGKARLARRQTYAVRKSEEWNLSYNAPLHQYGRRDGTQYRTLFTGTRAECIDAIPGIVEDLTALYKEVMGGETCTTETEGT